MIRGIADVQAELDGIARQIARLLTTSPVDHARLDELDRAAAELRGKIQSLRPAPFDDVRTGSRLVPGA